MAGGKETPRQKMIGLMYLVLLALLALQVGAEIMTKFAQLNDSLSLFVDESQKKSTAILGNIAEKVAERGNQKAEKEALQSAQELNKKSTALIKWIEDVKEELIAATDGRDPETGAYMGMKDTDKSSAILIGEGDKTDGKGYDLQKKLNAYIAYLNEVSKKVAKATGEKAKVYPKLALDGKEDPIFVHQSGKKKGKEKIEGAKTKDFPHLNFDHTPMIASLAFLTEKQSKVAAYEGEILEQLKGTVGASDFKFDNVFAMALPESKIVAAGTDYKAQMFISASSTGMKPKMKFAGRDLNVINGRGEVKFKVKGAGKYDKDGKAEKTWKGYVTIPHPVTGADTTFELVEKYYVAKPVIQVQSASISSLYKDCGNELNIQVPALGANYNPSFGGSTGAKVIKNPKKKGYITVIPSAATVKLKVASGGTPIGTESFKVRLVPKPDIVAYYKGKPVNLKTGVKGCPRNIEMRAIPESNFAAQMKKDARFKVTKWEATLVRGRRPVQPKKSFSSGKGALTSFVSAAKPGDRIMIEVLKVKRLNYQNRKLDVKIPATIINIPLTD